MRGETLLVLHLLSPGTAVSCERFDNVFVVINMVGVCGRKCTFTSQANLLLIVLVVVVFLLLLCFFYVKRESTCLKPEELKFEEKSFSRA